MLNHENTIHLPPLAESAFRLPLESDTWPVIEIVPDQIVTRLPAERDTGRRGLAVDPGHDVLLVASIEHACATGRLGLGRWRLCYVSRGRSGSRSLMTRTT